MINGHKFEYQLDTPQRLDQFLTPHFPNISRSQIQRWIEEERVLVNGRKRPKHFFLKKGYSIVVTKISEPQQKKPQTVIPDVSVIFEDKEILVIDKPVGLLVHQALNSNFSTLVDFLLKHYPPIINAGEKGREGIVHRLDREVSGVMVVAKTQKSFLNLQEQFKQRTVEKEYRAIVFGVPQQKVGEITFKIAHSATRQGKMAARPEVADGKEALTQYEVLKTWPHYALLKIKIKTGRTHQIRAHLAALGHPTVGDNKYFLQKFKRKKVFPRLFLHSYKLTFCHPTTNKKITFTSPLPPEFSNFK